MLSLTHKLTEEVKKKGEKLKGIILDISIECVVLSHTASSGDAEQMRSRLEQYTGYRVLNL